MTPNYPRSSPATPPRRSAAASRSFFRPSPRSSNPGWPADEPEHPARLPRGRHGLRQVSWPGLAGPGHGAAAHLRAGRAALPGAAGFAERRTQTLNRRISSLSSFYKYLAAAAAELRLPITVPNPAHAQFISRESTDPREETRASRPLAPASWSGCRPATLCSTTAIGRF